MKTMILAALFAMSCSFASASEKPLNSFGVSPLVVNGFVGDSHSVFVDEAKVSMGFGLSYQRMLSDNLALRWEVGHAVLARFFRDPDDGDISGLGDSLSQVFAVDLDLIGFRYFFSEGVTPYVGAGLGIITALPPMPKLDLDAGVLVPLSDSINLSAGLTVSGALEIRSSDRIYPFARVGGNVGVEFLF